MGADDITGRAEIGTFVFLNDQREFEGNVLNIAMCIFVITDAMTPKCDGANVVTMVLLIMTPS